MRKSGTITVPREHQVVFVRWRVTEGAAKVHEQVYLRPQRAWTKVEALRSRGVAEVHMFVGAIKEWHEHT